MRCSTIGDIFPRRDQDRVSGIATASRWSGHPLPAVTLRKKAIAVLLGTDNTN